MYVPNIVYKSDENSNDINIVDINSWIISEKKLIFPLDEDIFIFQLPKNINICINNIWIPGEIFDFFYPLYITHELSSKMEIYENGKLTDNMKVWCIDMNGYDMANRISGVIGYPNKFNIDYNENIIKYGKSKYTIYQILYERVLINRRSNTMRLLDNIRDDNFYPNVNEESISFFRDTGNILLNSILNEINS